MIIMGNTLNEERRATIWRLYDEGYTSAEIAERFGVTPSTINYHINKRKAQAELARLQQMHMPYDISQKMSPFGYRHGVYQLNYIDAICMQHTAPTKYAALMGEDVPADTNEDAAKRNLKSLQIRTLRTRLRACINSLNKLKTNKA